MQAGWVNLGIGLLLVAISIPLWLGQVPMNGWYGFRLPKSYESDENWYRINRFGGQAGVVTGVVIALIGLVCLIRPPESKELEVLLLIAPAFLILPMVVAGAWYAGRL